MIKDVENLLDKLEADRKKQESKFYEMISNLPQDKQDIYRSLLNDAKNSAKNGTFDVSKFIQKANEKINGSNL